MGTRPHSSYSTNRYPQDAAVESFGRWNDDYANAMRNVYSSHTNDPDVCCLFAEAIMNRTPWQLWDLQSGKPAEGADTLEAVTVLDHAFETLNGAWKHPGLLHMYIHLMEMSAPPRARITSRGCVEYTCSERWSPAPYAHTHRCVIAVIIKMLSPEIIRQSLPMPNQ